MKLYWAPNTRSVSALWMLEELGVPYQRELVDIRAGAQNAPAFRAINPMGKVPVVADGQTIVSEQSAICAWLADRFPEKKLAPAIDDPMRGDYLRWLFFAGNCIEPAYMQKASGWSTTKSQAGWGDYKLVVDVLDGALKRRSLDPGQAIHRRRRGDRLGRLFRSRLPAARAAAVVRGL